MVYANFRMSLDTFHLSIGMNVLLEVSGLEFSTTMLGINKLSAQFGKIRG